MKALAMKSLQHLCAQVVFPALLAGIMLLSPPVFAGSGVQVAVPTHDIARGSEVQASDFTYVTMAAGAVQPGMLQSKKDVDGMVTRRMLQAGQPVRSEDFRLEQLVKRGAIVTMYYNVPGIELTATMRAIKAGGMGETVIVQNPVSFKQVGAIVTGPGQVRAISAPVTQLSRAGQ